MSLLALAALTGIALPPLIAVVQQEKWGTRTKTIVTVVLVVGAAVGALFGRGDWHGWTPQTLHYFGPILSGLILGTWGSYAHLWQNLGITQLIERVTTFRKAVNVFDQLPAAQRAALEAEAFGLLKIAANTPTPPATAPPVP